MSAKVKNKPENFVEEELEIVETEQVNKVGYVIITDDLRVETDGVNLTLQVRKPSTRKDNIDGFIWETEGYFRHWDAVMERVMRVKLSQKIIKQEAVILSGFLKMYKELAEEIREWFKLK